MADIVSATTGRIVYFEPNETFGGDNQPVNQEDLTKYVNLSVRIPSRIYNGGGNRIYDSILKGTPFEKTNDGYTKFYLTDNYVNMTYTEFGSDGEISTGELFGIESINISFDVQFFPQVVINFIDIKGLGLMSTMEYNYEHGKVNNLTAKSFFTSLFNFPYPIFTLEVKGYYGKSMSFDLTLKDFHTAFDSTTGNFRTTVSFIGHLYGVYGDIPMSYLMASPYFDYTGELDAANDSEYLGDTWNSIGDNTIPTYIGFLKKYEEILKGDDLRGEGVDVIGETQALEKEKLDLENVLELYNGIIEHAQGFADGHCFKNENDYTICQCTNSPEQTSNLKSFYWKGTDGNGKFWFFKEGKSLIIFYEKNDDGTGLETAVSPYYDYIKEYEQSIDEEYKINVDKYDDHFKNSEDVFLYISVFSDIFQKKAAIENRIASINTQILRTNNEISEALVSVVSEKLGFKPCIKNIYQMIYKHLDCFSRQFFTTITNVERNRTKESLAIPNGYYTDVPKYEDNGVIPPFPMFAQEVNDDQGKHKKIIYPGNIGAFFEQPEVAMVENIYDSLEYYINKLARAESDIETALIEQSSGQKINLKTGTLFADLDDSIDINKKNYYVVSEIDNGEDKAKYIRDIFLSRLNTFGRFHYRSGDGGASLDYFNDIESKLLYSSNPDINEDTLRCMINLTSLGLFNEFKKLSGTTDIGFVNYDEEIGKNVSNYDGDLKLHVADQNDLKNIVRIFGKGDYSRCKAIIDSFQIDENYKYVFPYLIYKWEYGGTESTNYPSVGTLGVYNDDTYKLNKRKKVAVFEICGSYGGKRECDDVISKGSWWLQQGVDENVVKVSNEYYLPTNTLFSHEDNGYENPLFDWACDAYQTKYETLYHCQRTLVTSADEWLWDVPGHRARYTADVYEITNNSYESATITRVTQNRIVVISLAYLLAIGELFYYSWQNDDGNYFVPLSIIRDRSKINFNGGYNYYYAKYFEPHTTKFGRLMIGLYKTFYNLSPSVQDQEYYNYLVESGDGVVKGDIENACTKWYVIGKEAFNNNNYSFSPCNASIKNTDVQEVWSGFLDNLFNLYGFERSIVESYKTKEEAKKQILELKTNIYYTLKTLYDKWYSGLNQNFFNMYRLGNIIDDSEFNRISYLTTTFNDISESLIIDIESFSNQILSIRNDASDAQRSVLSYMAKTAQDNQSTFLVLPTNIFDENLQDAFKTYNFYDGSLKHDNHGSSYVVMYNGDVSHNLDNPASQYEQDGYDIANYHDGVLKITEAALSVTDTVAQVVGKHDYTMQAFGVTYGMQNQNIFKNISVDTQTPQITDYSITNMLTIAEQGSELADGGKSMVKTQSLYPVYANRSYNCSVEMMGCVSITPLMYFQLNNIPMFRGAYMITNVEHKITANDFTTTFTGVRVSKYNIPINIETINISRVGSLLNNDGTYTSAGSANESVDNTSVQPFINTSVVFDTSKDIINLDPEGKYWMPYSGNTHSCEPNEEDCNNAARSSAQNIIRGLINENQTTYARLRNVNACSHTQGGSASRSILLLKEKMKISANNTFTYDTNETGLYYYLNSGETPQEKYRKTVKLIKDHLAYGLPIRIGVNHHFDIPDRNEGTTDHFLTIYAFGIYEQDFTPDSYDEMLERYRDIGSEFDGFGSTYRNLNGRIEYYRYYETGSNVAANAVNKNNILIYVDQENPLFFAWDWRNGRWYDVTLVSPYNIVGGPTTALQLDNYMSTYINVNDTSAIKCPREEYENYKSYYQ